MLSLALLFVLVFFLSVLVSIVITSLGKERYGLCSSRAFVYFARVNCRPFSLPNGVRGWLRCVILALPCTFLLTFIHPRHLKSVLL